MRLLPIEEDGRRFCRFEVVHRQEDQSDGTITGGDAKCPFPSCNETISRDEIKRQAQAGEMAQQLYAVVYRYDKEVGKIKTEGRKLKRERGFRAPRAEDNLEALVAQRLAEKMPDWEARDIVPDRSRYLGPSDRCGLFGVRKFIQMFSKRQLIGHCTNVEVFQEMLGDLENSGSLSELDRAALTYLRCDRQNGRLEFAFLHWIPRRRRLVIHSIVTISFSVTVSQRWRPPMTGLKL